jgi:hypothetical protein
MAGSPLQLLCNEFVETDGFVQSRAIVMVQHDLSVRDVDDRLEALIWGMNHDADFLAEQVPGRNLWVAMTDWPRLRVFIRPSPDVLAECELLWIEDVL